jgi:type III secretion system YscD/HrpQ family protein
MSAHAEILPQVTLLVRSGKHEGASLELPETAYVIGADADCDIVLTDSGIAPRHCRVTRHASGVSVWDIRPGKARLLRPLAVSQENGECRSTYAIGSTQLVFSHRAPEPSERVCEPEPARRRSRALIATSALLVVLLLTTIVIAAADQIAARMRSGVAERVEKGDASLRAQGFSTVRFQLTKQGDLELVGTVATAAEKSRLRLWIASGAYQSARFKVHAADSITQQVRDALADESVRVRFDRGRLRIEGTTSNPAVRKRIQTVTEDLKGVIPIEDRVAYVEAVDAPGPLPVRVRDVKVGDARYFSSDNGERYFEGAVLPDGAEVIAIEATQIRFRRNGRVLVYPLSLD